MTTSGLSEPGISQDLGRTPEASTTSEYPSAFNCSASAFVTALSASVKINEQFNLLRIVDNERYPAYFYKEGKKYIKIIRDRGVWGFVVKEDGPKFKKGDILKAAGYNAPATNAARGNIFEEFSVAWTGPHYLK